MSKEFTSKQIVKFANKMSLIDAVDNLDTLHSVTGKFNKKVTLNVNNYGGQNHREKFAAYYWDIDEALIVCKDIVDGTFKDNFYGGKNAGIYSSYGGGKVSRIITIGFKEDRYTIQVALYGAIKGANGQIIPDKNNPIDTHQISLNIWEARKFFGMIYATIVAKMPVLVGEPGNATTHTFTFTQPVIPSPTIVQAPVKETPKQAPTPTPEPQEEDSNLDDMFGGFSFGDE